MFQGFSEKTVEFLWGIRFNNDRAWFEARREEYRTCLYGPMRELAFAVWEKLSAAEGMETLSCHVSRIYRDARRTHGRGPYKDRLWFGLREGGLEDRPTFYFELNPEGYVYGLGYYAPSPALLSRFRAGLDAHPRKFAALARDLQRQQVFEIESGEYKKKKGERPAPLDRWYNLKSPGMTAERPLGPELYAPEFAGRLAEELELLLPLYRYLREI